MNENKGIKLVFGRRIFETIATASAGSVSLSGLASLRRGSGIVLRGMPQR